MYSYNSFYYRLSAFTVQRIHELYSEEFGQDLLDQIISSDPTYQGGDQVGSYTPWLIKQFRSGNTQQDELGAISTALDIFNRMKTNLEIKDIYQYQNIDQLFTAINPYIESNQQTQSEKKEKGANILYDDNQWLLIEPLTFEAECLYGAGTKWCTTSEAKGRPIFEGILEKAPIYIIIDRNSGKKFQFDSSTESFNNELNKLDYQGFINLGPPQELINLLIPHMEQIAIQENSKWTDRTEFIVEVRQFELIKSQIIQEIIDRQGTSNLNLLKKMLIKTFFETYDIDFEKLVNEPMEDRYNNIIHLLVENSLLYSIARDTCVIQSIKSGYYKGYKQSLKRLQLEIQGLDILNSTYIIENEIEKLLKKTLLHQFGYSSYDEMENAVITQAIKTLPIDPFTVEDIINIIQTMPELFTMFENMIKVLYNSTDLSNISTSNLSSPVENILYKYLNKDYLLNILYKLSREGYLSRKYKKKIPYFTKV